ncbi:MAG: hypothetical protein MZV63_68400 [Marinilabiliales bacterium]|nr:hypothetical protein [Marinilabiliales bacterium]
MVVWIRSAIDSTHFHQGGENTINIMIPAEMAKKGVRATMVKSLRSCNKPVSRDIDYSLPQIGSHAYVPGSGKPEGYKVQTLHEQG